MDMKEYERAKFELADLLRSASLVARAAQPKNLYPLEDLFARLAEDRFNLAVVGQFSRGKTSLMNAMLNTERLPTGIVPLTSVITTVQYGTTECARIEFQENRLPFEFPWSLSQTTSLNVTTRETCNGSNSPTSNCLRKFFGAVFIWSTRPNSDRQSLKTPIPPKVFCRRRTRSFSSRAMTVHSRMKNFGCCLISDRMHKGYSSSSTSRTLPRKPTAQRYANTFVRKSEMSSARTKSKSSQSRLATRWKPTGRETMTGWRRADFQPSWSA